MITLWRILKSGFRNLFRNAWLSVAATAIMVVTLVVVSFSIFAAVFLRNSVDTVKSRIDLSIYLSDEATITQIEDLQAKLTAIENVEGVEYKSKDDILEEYKNSADPEKREIARAAVESEGGFAATLQVRASELDNLEPINQLISTDEFKPIVSNSSVDSDNNRRSTIEKIGKISNATAKIGAVASVAFLIIALMIIFNTIRMAIFTRREEIEIMKLVGATKWFIRGPFIVEGALYGVMGAIIATAIILPLINVIEPYLIKAVESATVIEFITSRMSLIIGAEFAAGIIIGAISSWLAISRHLKL